MKIPLLILVSLIAYQASSNISEPIRKKVDSLNHEAAINLYSNHQKSYQYAMHALKNSRENNYLQGQAMALNNLGNYNSYRGGYTQAMDRYYSSLKLCEKHRFQELKAKVLSNIGNVNFFLNNSSKAVEYNRKGLHIFYRLNDLKGVANCYRNIGNVFFHSSDYDSSLFYYKKAQSYYQALEDTNGMAATFHNLALIHNNQHNYCKGKEYYQKSLNYYTCTNDKRGIALVKINMANLYIKNEQYNKAADNLHHALNITSVCGMKEWEMNIYQIFSGLYEKKNDVDKAYIYFKKYHKLNDSLRNEKRIQQINALQEEFETAQIKKENQLQKLKLTKRAQSIKILIVAGFILISALAGLVYLIARLRSNMKKVSAQKLIIENQHDEILKKRQELFDQKMKEKQKELTSNAIFLGRANKKSEKILSELKKALDNSKDPLSEIKKMLHKYRMSFLDNNLNEFELQFNHLHSDFYSLLSKDHPDLTPKEKRLCAFLRLNMTSKEIASITLTGESSINVARSRLRMKLNISKNENLVNYLSDY